MNVGGGSRDHAVISDRVDAGVKVLIAVHHNRVGDHHIGSDRQEDGIVGGQCESTGTEGIAVADPERACIHPDATRETI